MRHTRQQVEHRRAVSRMNRASHRAMRWCTTITDLVLAAAEEGLVMGADGGCQAKLASIADVVLGTSSDVRDIEERLERIESYLSSADRIAYLESRNADLMRRNFDLSRQLRETCALLPPAASEAPNAG